MKNYPTAPLKENVTPEENITPEENVTREEKGSILMTSRKRILSEVASRILINRGFGNRDINTYNESVTVYDMDSKGITHVKYVPKKMYDLLLEKIMSLTEDVSSKIVIKEEKSPLEKIGM